jgi:hypothetical protein
MTAQNGSGSDQAASHQLPSHVHMLLHKAAASPARMAPERVEELKNLVEKHRIEIIVKDEAETKFEMGAMYGKIFTPMRVYHHLWAAALIFAALYVERESHSVNEGWTGVDLDSPEIMLVWGNYLLSCSCFKKDEAYPIPPSVDVLTSRGDYLELADELFLEMVAFCILHEFAHLEHGDSKTDENGKPINTLDPHQIELAADKWAYDWILSKWRSHSTDPRAFIKRTLGIIFSLAMIDEFRHHRGENFGSSHPDAADRLLQFFEDYQEQISSNNWRTTCLTATYIGLQVVAFANHRRIPTSGYSDAIGLLKAIKAMGEEPPKSP